MSLRKIKNRPRQQFFLKGEDGVVVVVIYCMTPKRWPLAKIRRRRERRQQNKRRGWMDGEREKSAGAEGERERVPSFKQNLYTKIRRKTSRQNVKKRRRGSFRSLLLFLFWGPRH